LIIWLIFFLILQTKPSFCRLFAWSQLDFPAIPVSISAVSLKGYQLIQDGSDKSGIFFFFLLNVTAQLKIIRFFY
jgi:hypothetical protein